MYKFPSTGGQGGVLSIENFRGVDFATSPVSVSPSRSPDALNLISNLAGFPVSRTGYEVMLQVEGRINGVYILEAGGEVKRLVHHGTKLSLWTAEGLTNLSEQVADDKSSTVQFDSKLYFFDGKKALVYGQLDKDSKEFSLKPLADIAYIPTTVISRGATGGGESFEGVNLIQPKRINSFLCKSGETVFKLDTDKLADTPVVARKLSASGKWTEIKEGSGLTVDRAGGNVTLSSAPGVTPVTGRDNLEIEFAKEMEGYQDKINGCTICVTFGASGNSDRLFLAGNPKQANLDWYSEAKDLTYFPDLNYTKVGESNSQIMGYSRLSDGTLAIHKERKGEAPTVYIRRDGTLDGKTVFPLSQGASGVGVVAKRGFGTLVNDPLILSDQGVFAVIPVPNSGVNERYAQQRSYYINPRLKREANLAEAEAISVHGFYYLAVNGNVYVADSRQKSYTDKAMADQYQYEWYFWDNLPVRIFWEDNGLLHFGTADGKLCRFFPEGGAYPYTDDGKAIKCYWSTPILNLGRYTHYKKIKNVLAVPSPYARSEINIDYIVKSIPKTVKMERVNIFSFEDIDFNEFTFETDFFPRVVPTNTKARKVMLIQFRLWADSGKPFGLYGFTCTYSYSGKYK